jgi:protein O-mannosyl-transferase
LLHTAFWVEHRLWGDETTGYHIVNILMHVLAAFLAACVMRRLGIPGAWFAAAIFALHPVHVESVAWITELKNTLSAVFYLGAVLLYLRFDEARERRSGPGTVSKSAKSRKGDRPTVAASRAPARNYLGAFGLFTLAMLSKTVTGTLPGALLVIRWWQCGRLSWKRDVLPLVPFFAVGAGGGMITAWWEVQFNRVASLEFHLTPVERFLVAGRAIWFHLSKLAWPADLNFIYPRWQIDAHAAWQYAFPIAGLALLGALWSLRKRTRAPLAGALFFCGSLVPVLGFFNLYTFRYSFAANHYQYLASLGICALVPAGGKMVLERLRLRAAAGCLSIALLAVLAMLTWRQSHEFADAETLYRETLRHDPSSWMAHTNLSAVLLGSDANGAMAEAQAALRIKPDHAPALNNLGLALQKLGRREEARQQYLRALRARPEYAQALNNLGLLLQEDGRLGDAEARYREALRSWQNYPEAHYNLANVLQLTGRIEESIEHYRETLRILPDSVPARHNLAIALQRLNRKSL